MEEKFVNSKNEYVKRLIPNEFVGSYSYLTRCLKCNKTSERKVNFYELEIILQKINSLEDGLQNYLQEETLSGNNQYHCAFCNELTDAKRKIELKELPNVLNFQLLRFMFDSKSAQRKKLHTKIEFPKYLNMNSFLPFLYLFLSFSFL